MRKQQFITLLLLVATLSMAAQSYVPVVFIVSDFSTNKTVNGAQVSIRQAGWATKSTGTDGKVSFDNVPVGAINFIITKDGYQLYEGEENISAEVKSNTFRIPLTIIPTTKDKILVTGEVTDKDGREIDGAMVEVKAANVIQNGLTDKSGNYSIEISLNTGYPVSNLTIEAKKGDCKVKQTVDIPRGNVVAKDLILDCNSKGTALEDREHAIQEPTPTHKFEKGPWVISLSECKQSGSNVNCSLTIVNNSTDAEISVNARDNSRIFASNGYEFGLDEAKLADKFGTNQWVNKSVVKGVPIKATFTFTNVSEEISLITKMEVSCRDLNGINYFSLVLQNIKVKK